MSLALNQEFEAILQPFGSESANFFLAAGLYHARKLSFAAAAHLSGLSHQDFAARLREHFGTGFLIDEEVLHEDVRTVNALSSDGR